MNNQTVFELNKRKLDECYFSIYSIPTNVYLYDEKSKVSTPKVLLLFFGCNLRGQRRYIASALQEDLDKVSDWYNFFMSFKNRNLKTILYALFDDNKYINKAIKLAFPEIEIFHSYCSSLMKVNKYLSSRYSSSIYELIKRIFVSENIDEYNINLDEFKSDFNNSPFIIDLLEPELIKAKESYKYDYKLRKHVFAFYFVREIQKKLVVVSHSKPYFTSNDDFISSCIDIIQMTEKRVYCPKNEWISLINTIYNDKKELIKEYF